LEASNNNVRTSGGTAAAAAIAILSEFECAAGKGETFRGSQTVNEGEKAMFRLNHLLIIYRCSFLLTFGEKWRTNRNVMLILHTIVLFTPRPNYPLASKDAVGKLHAEYCALLKRQEWNKIMGSRIFLFI
jgi:hypothetical protein